MLKIILVITVIYFTFQTNASRILVVIPTPSYSHQSALWPIWKELSLRGHQVTLATTDPIHDPKLVNLTEINMHDMYNHQVLMDLHTQVPTANVLKILELIYRIGDVTFDYPLSTFLKPLLKNESVFDLVIVENLVPEYLAFADLFNCPSVVISPFEVSSTVYTALGNPFNPIAYPEMVLPFIGGQLSFRERIISFLFSYLFYGYKMLAVSKRKILMQKYFGKEVRSVEKLWNDVDLLLINTNPIINDIRPLGPNTITFGGANHVLPPRPLPKDLQVYLDNAEEGCIYFSLGTNVKNSMMTNEKIHIIIDTLSELPYKILWKYDGTDIIDVPENIKLIPWAPQQDILRHPNVKLFITQGGMQSLEESVINHKPMVMLPMFADQAANARRMEHRGVSKTVPHKPLPRKEEFKSIVLEVIQNPKYKENIIKMADLLLDQPETGTEKAVLWLEHILRHNGGKHLRNPSLDMPIYEFYYLDVTATITLINFAIYKIISYTLKLFIKQNNSKKL
ncbi:UDP-glycosyltransferase UGT5-like [Diorhabda sublineata]|uniref:UDP-glycosyltransferase UGT5-like n=1 Tax=Diorhabda sublineata TaxID=1163346 RepID=UPI0024E14C7C|nr:UDP-glycosyltransferase UGT5-like [Diorhabda sublineata]